MPLVLEAVVWEIKDNYNRFRKFWSMWKGNAFLLDWLVDCILEKEENTKCNNGWNVFSTHISMKKQGRGWYVKVSFNVLWCHWLNISAFFIHTPFHPQSAVGAFSICPSNHVIALADHKSLGEAKCYATMWEMDCWHRTDAAVAVLLRENSLMTVGSRLWEDFVHKMRDYEEQSMWESGASGLYCVCFSSLGPTDLPSKPGAEFEMSQEYGGEPKSRNLV